MKREFFRFLAAGTAVGLAGLAVLQGLLWVAGSHPWAEAAAIGVTYLLGALLSFCLQQAYVFRRRAANPRSVFAVFLALTVAVSLAVSVLSGLLLSWPPMRAVFGQLAAFVAFALACLAGAPFSYSFTRILIRSAAPRPG